MRNSFFNRPNNESSRLSKAELFRLYKNLYSTERRNYHQMKQAAGIYQRCKYQMFRGFELYYSTGWISKDPCLSMFL